MVFDMQATSIKIHREVLKKKTHDKKRIMQRRKSYGTDFILHGFRKWNN